MATRLSAKLPFRWPEREIEAFCQRWKIVQLDLFGSVLREDFRPDSDVDLLVEFSSGAEWSLLDHARMERELEEILGRSVDLVTRWAVEESPNWIRRDAILSTARQVYGR